MKRLLAGLLSIILVFSLIPASAFAEGEEPIAPPAGEILDGGELEEGEPEAGTEGDEPGGEAGEGDLPGEGGGEADLPAGEGEAEDGLGGETRSGTDPIPVTGITVTAAATGVYADCDPANALYAGHPRQLTAVVEPEDADVQAVSWSSSDTAVATVDANGLVTMAEAAEPGQTVVITAAATDESGVTGSYVLLTQLYAAPQPTLEVGGDTGYSHIRHDSGLDYIAEYEPGAAQVVLAVAASASDGGSLSYEWQIFASVGSDPTPIWTREAEYDRGEPSITLPSMFFNSQFRCKITAAWEGYESQTEYVYFTMEQAEGETEETSIRIESRLPGENAFKVAVGGWLPLYVVTSGNAVGGVVDWSRDAGADLVALIVSAQDSDVCQLMGLAEGEVVMRATYYADNSLQTVLASDTRTITVVAADQIPVSELTIRLIRNSVIHPIEGGVLNLWASDTVQLFSDYNPMNAAKPAVSWTSSDESIATVDENGLVTGVGTGTATITLKPQGADTPSDTVTVAVHTDAAAVMRAELQAPGPRTVTLNTDLVLTENLVIPFQKTLQIAAGSTLTVPQGVTLENHGGIEVLGTLNFNGLYPTEAPDGQVWQMPGGVISCGETSMGLHNGMIECQFRVTNLEELTEALDAADIYKFVQIFMSGNITLAADEIIPGNASLQIGGGDSEAGTVTLTVPAGVKLSVDGALFVYGRLQNNGTVEIGISGHFSAPEGSVSGNEVTYLAPSYQVGSTAELIAAIDAGLGYIEVAAPFTLTESVTIPAGSSLHLRAELTVPAGVELCVAGYSSEHGGTTGSISIYDPAGALTVRGTLTNHGFCYFNDGALTVKAGGTLANSGYINISGVLTVEAGGTYSPGEYGGMLELQPDGTITGIDESEITLSIVVTDEAGLRAAMAPNAYKRTIVRFSGGTITLSGHLTIPDYAELHVGDGGTADPETRLIVPENVKLTAEGSLYIWSRGTLEILGTVEVWGDYSAEGVVIGEVTNPRNVGSTDGLIAAIEAGLTDITVTEPFTLTENVTIPAHCSLYLEAALTVAAGVELTTVGYVDGVGSGCIYILDSAGALIVMGTLTNYGSVNVAVGALTVKAGGTLANSGYTSLSGVLTIEADGTYSPGEYGGMLELLPGGMITGIDESEITLIIMVTDETELRTAMAPNAYKRTIVQFLGSTITLSGHLTIPDYAELNVGGWGDSGPQARLVVPENVELIVEGSLQICPRGILEIIGTVVITGDYYAADGSTVIGEVTDPRRVGSTAELIAAIEAGRTNITVAAPFTLTENVTIPADTGLQLEAELCVGAGVELILAEYVEGLGNGMIGIYDAAGALTIYGTLTNHGYIGIDRGALTVKSGGTLVNNSVISVESVLTVEAGGAYRRGEHGGGMLELYPGATISGVGESEIEFVIPVTNEAELRAAMAPNAYRRTQVQFTSGTITLSGHLTVPDYVNFYVGGWGDMMPQARLVVPENIEMTVEGDLQICPRGILEIIGTVEILGHYYSEGVVIGDVTDIRNVGSTAALIAAIEKDLPEIWVTAPFTLTESVTIPADTWLWIDADLTVPEGVELCVAGPLDEQSSSGNIIISSSAAALTVMGTLTNRGFISVDLGALTVKPDGTLANYGDVDVGGRLDVEAGGTYSAGGYCTLRLCQGGVITGVAAGEISNTVSVATEAELRAAIEPNEYKKTHIEFDAGTITLGDHMTIPSYVELGVGSWDSEKPEARLVVPANIELRVEGDLWVCPRGTLEILGTVVITGEYIVMDGGTVIGTVTDLREVGSTAELITAIEAGMPEIWIIEAFSLTEDVTIPADCMLYIEAALTVPAGFTLRLDGGTVLSESGTLTVDEGGTIVIAAGGFLDTEYGTFINNGVLVQEGADVTEVATMAELLAAIEAGSGTIRVTGNITLAENLLVSDFDLVVAGELVVPAGMSLTFEEGVFGVEAGEVIVYGTLTNGPQAYITDGGSLTIAAGGRLNNNGTIEVGSGTLAVNGVYTAGERSEVVHIGMDGEVTGVDKDQIVREYYGITAQALIDALTQTGYRELQIVVEDNISVNSALTVPAGAYLSVSTGAALSIGEDGSLHNQGSIYVYEGSELTVGPLDNEGSIRVRGTLNADSLTNGVGGEIEVESVNSLHIGSGGMTNNGRLSISGAMTVSGGTLRNNGDIRLSGTLQLDTAVTGYYTEYVNGKLYVRSGALPDGINAARCIYWTEVWTLADVTEAIAASAGYRGAWLDAVQAFADTLTNDFTIPAGVSLSLPADASLTIPAGRTLTVAGELILNEGASLLGGGTLKRETGGVTRFDGTVADTITIDAADNVQTEAELLAAIAAGQDIRITGDIVLTADLDLSVVAVFEIAGRLTVPAGRTLTVSRTWPGVGGDQTTGELLVYGTLINNTGIAVGTGGSLIIAEGGLLDNNGRIYVTGGTVRVARADGYDAQGNQNEDALRIGWYAGLGYGEIIGIDKAQIVLECVPATEQELMDALAQTGYRKISVFVDQALVINGVLTVPAGAELTVRTAGALTIGDGGLVNNGSITVQPAASLNFGSADDYTEGEAGRLVLYEGGTVSGLPTTACVYAVTVSDMAGLLTACGMKPQYRRVEIACASDFAGTLTQEHYTIQPGVRLYLPSGASLTIPAGKTLHVYGELVTAEGSAIEGAGTLVRGNRDSLTINGTVADTITLDIAGSVATEAELRETIAAGYESICITGDITLTDDLLIPAGVDLFIVGGSLTVPAGVTLHVEGAFGLEQSIQGITGTITIDGTLINDGDVYILGGTMTIGAGGAMQNNRLLTVSGGTLRVNGSYSAGQDGRLELITIAGSDDPVIEGIARDQIVYVHYIGTAAELSDALALTGYRSVELIVGMGDTVTVASELTVPESFMLVINNGGTVQFALGGRIINRGQILVREGGTLALGLMTNEGTLDILGTVTVDGALTNNREIFVWELSSLCVSDVGLMINNDYIRIEGTVTVNRRLHNGGSIYLNDGGALSFDTTVEDFYTADEYSWVYLHDGATLTGLPESECILSAEAADIPALEAAIARLPGYVGVEIVCLDSFQETLEADLLIPLGVRLNLWSSASLTIPAGKTLTVAGDLVVGGNASLLGDGVIWGEPGCLLALDGTVAETLTIVDPRNVDTEEALIAAMASGVNEIFVTGDITLTESLTIVSDVQLYLEATLTVPRGLTLTVPGNAFLYLFDPAAELRVGGVLNNYCWISVVAGRLTVLTGGAYRDTGEQGTGTLSLSGDGGGVITGIAKSQIQLSFSVASEAALHAALTKISGYPNVQIRLEGAFYEDDVSVTLSKDLTVPAAVRLIIGNGGSDAGAAELIVPSGVKLINKGTIEINESGTLEIRSGATLNTLEGWVHANNGTLLIAEGAIVLGDDISATRYVEDIAGLRAALEGGYNEVNITGNIRVDENLTVPAGVTLNIGYYDEVSLTVASGATLTCNGLIDVYGGELLVEEGGRLQNNNRLWIEWYGRVNVNGTLAHGEGGSTWILDTGEGAWSTNIPHSQLYYELWVSDFDGMKAGLAGKEDYLCVVMQVENSFAVTENFTIPANVELQLNEYFSSRLTVNGGVRLENNGSIYVAGGSRLVIKANGVVVNNGYMNLDLGCLVKEGLGASQGRVEGTIPDIVVIFGEGATIAQINAAIKAGATKVYIEGSVRLLGSLTIPAGVRLGVDVGGSLTMPSSYTLTNNGELIVWEGGRVELAGKLVNNGQTYVCDGSEMSVAGKVTGQRILVFEGGLLTAPGDAPRADAGVEAAEVAVLEGGFYNETEDRYEIGLNNPTQFTALVLPGNAWDNTVNWASDGGEITEDGILTADTPGAEITVTATAADGSGTQGSRTVTVVNYALEITQAGGADWMMAGKTLQLAAAFKPGNLTGTSVLWSIDPADAAFASISAKGLVTAKAVTEQQEITVIAAAADGAATEARYDITIYPTAISAAITDVPAPGEAPAVLTGQTLLLNTNDSTELPLGALAYPLDARQGFSWTSSNMGVATVDQDGVVHAVETAAGSGVYKTGLVTITAKTTDGSNRTAIVKVNVAALAAADSLRIATVAPFMGTLTSGQKGMLEYDFELPLPSNKAVTWSVDPAHTSFVKIAASGTRCTVTAQAVTNETTARIWATAKDGSGVTAYRDITILPQVSSVTISAQDLTMPGMYNLKKYEDPGWDYEPITFTAATLPADAGNDVVWSTSDTRGLYGTYTLNEDGSYVLMPTGTPGTVTLKAAATDGSNKSATMKIVLGRFERDVQILNAPAEMSSGQSIQLLTNVGDKTLTPTLTDRSITWSLSGGGAQYATISASGRLTTTALPAGHSAVQIIVEAKSKDDRTEAWITLRPAATNVVISEGGVPLISGQTIRLDTAAATSLTLSAETLPEAAADGITWTSSSAAIASVDQNGVVTAGTRAGTATITAKAKDGSNKLATVKVQVGALVTDITLTAAGNAAELRSGKSLQLTAAVLPASATIKTVTWSLPNAEDAAYVTLSASGRLTGKTVYDEKEITVRATAKDGGGAYGEYSLTVKPAADGILIITKGSRTYSPNITKQTLPMELGDSVNVFASILGDANESPNEHLLKTREAVWTTSAPSVLRQTPQDIGGSGELGGYCCNIAPIKAGTATVTAKYTDEAGKVKTASFTVKVSKLAEEITVGSKTGVLEVAAGKTLAMMATVAPASAANKAVTWSLSDEDKAYASISAAGVLSAGKTLLDERTVTVIATAKDGSGVTGSCEVQLKPLSLGVTIENDQTIAPLNRRAVGSSFPTLSDGVTLNGQTVVADLGALEESREIGNWPFTLKASVYPETAIQTVTWTSSNKRLAEVDADGVLTVKAAGTVTITAKAADGSGKAASFKLTIVSEPVGLSLADDLQLRGGAKLTLKPIFDPVKPTNVKLNWSLRPEDAAYASISTSGVLTAKAVTAAREVEVTVTSQANGLATCTQTVTITPTVTGLALYRGDELVTGKTITLDLAAPEPELAAALSAVCYPYLESGLGARQDVSWTSSNPQLIAVDGEGNVSAVGTWNALTEQYTYKPGTATITAKALDGSGKSAKLTVKLVNLVQAITLSTLNDVTTLASLKSLTVKATLDPAAATNKALTWTLRPEDLAYATISTGGVVKAKKVTAPKLIEVTCLSKDGNAVSEPLQITIIP